eukprot:6649296-Alexandrium_andersonii.AAC.1
MSNSQTCPSVRPCPSRVRLCWKHSARSPGGSRQRQPRACGRTHARTWRGRGSRNECWARRCGSAST